MTICILTKTDSRAIMGMLRDRHVHWFAGKSQASCGASDSLSKSWRTHRTAGFYFGETVTNRTTESLRECAKKQWAKMTPEQREAAEHRLLEAAKAYYASDDWNNGGQERRSDKQKASWTEERKQARKTPEACKVQSESKLKFWASEKGIALKEQYARQAQERFAGKPKSRQQRARMSETRAKIYQNGFSPWAYTQRGHYTSTKTSKTMWYRSSYERRAMELLDTLPDVISFRAEAVRVPYEFEGGVHHYLPDLEVNLVNGRTVYVEVKPATRQLTAKEQAKMEAGKAAFGADFVVCTEQHLFTETIGSILNA